MTRRFRAVSVVEMRRIDRRATAYLGLPVSVLMENAGRAAALEAARRLPGPHVVVCGTGNNGGDGLVAARWLFNFGLRPRVLLARTPRRFGPDARVFWPAVKRLGIPWRVHDTVQKLVKFTSGCRGWVDALLGVGARAPLRAPYRALIAAINTDPRPVLSIDVPSGLDADTGRPLSEAVRADRTLVLGRLKRGLAARSARPWVGRRVVSDIGFPALLSRRPHRRRSTEE